MSTYPADVQVTVRPFVSSRDGDEVTIGDSERQVFLVIPADGLDILESLAAGRTVGEAALHYEERYGERVDIEDFLDALAGEGFVAPKLATGDAPEPHQHRRALKLSWITPGVARALTSWPVVGVQLAVIVGAVVLVVTDPGVVPPLEALAFPKGNFAVLMLLLLACTGIGVILHEIAHLTAARARGVHADVGFGNVVYTLVAQTNMGGLWLLPRAKRYFPYVYGIVLDSAVCAGLLFLLAADQRGFVSMNEMWTAQLVAALTFSYFLRISFQFFFYLRNDFYYVMATASGARNLMADTEVFLRNGIARLIGKPERVVDQSPFSKREMRSIRGYAVLYVIGRAFAMGMLVFIYIPLLVLYFRQFALLVTGSRDSVFHHVDAVVAALAFLMLTGGGIVYWIADMWRNRGRKTGSVLESAKPFEPDPALEQAS